MPANKNDATSQMLPMRDVAKLVKRHRTTIWRWIRERNFPKPKRHHGVAPLWSDAEVKDWLEENPELN